MPTAALVIVLKLKKVTRAEPAALISRIASGESTISLSAILTLVGKAVMSIVGFSEAVQVIREKGDKEQAKVYYEKAEAVELERKNSEVRSQNPE